MFVGEKYNSELSTTEIAKLIRTELKKKYPNCKFSVRSKYFSMGSSITVSVLKTPFRVIKKFEDLTEQELNFLQNRGISIETIKDRQGENYHQLNQYQKENLNNGVYLTDKGRDLINSIVEIVNSYNYDKSDPMTDYFNVNFWFHLELGTWSSGLIQPP